MLLSALISGLGLGSMYGLMALGFYITWSVSGTVNFAQGSAIGAGVREDGAQGAHEARTSWILARTSKR